MFLKGFGSTYCWPEFGVYLPKHIGTSNPPLYAWLNSLGVENIIISPLQRCTASSVHTVETKWVRVLGLTNILNR